MSDLLSQTQTVTSYTHSIKIEETAKGLRFHVHVYGNSERETIDSIVSTYENTIKRFRDQGYPIAPMNGVNKE